MIRSYWQNLMPRERWMLILGVAAVVTTLFYLLLLEPYQNERERLDQDIELQRELLGWMRGAAVEMQRLRGGGATPRGSAGAETPLLTLVDGSARRQGLGEALKRVQPDGQSGVRVWLEQVEFDALLPWLESLERDSGVKVSSLVIEPQDPGRVKARLSLERP